MKSKFNSMTGLYEQVSTDNQPPVNNTEIEDTNVENVSDVNGDTGKLHAFAIDSTNIEGIRGIISGKAKEWKSEVPLKVLGKDGTIGANAMLNGKPLYLMIRVATKTERASSELQLELSDRIYLLLNTSPSELANIVETANGIDQRVNIAVKGPNGIENTIGIWSEDASAEAPTEMPDDATVNVDLDAQIENPGTAAGITGTVEEVNEQNVFANMKKLAEVKKNLGAGAKVVTFDDGTTGVRITNATYYSKATFFNNGRVVITLKDGTILKGKYSNGGKTIVMDGGKGSVSGGSVWQNLGKVALGKTSAKAATKVSKGKMKSAGSKFPVAFKTQEEGDAFRAWANSTPELTAKYGKKSKFDLDPTGKFNNSYINKAYAAASEEYKAAKEQQEKEKNFKYKGGEIVYYRVKGDGSTEILADNTETKKIVDGQKKEMEKEKRKTTPIEDQYAQYGANPHTNEAIATSFDMFKQITEDDDLTDELASEDIDYQAGLIKDFKAGNVKKGKVIKQIDDQTIKLVNIKSNKEETVKLTDLISKEDAKKAALKIKADKEAEEAKNVKSDLEKSEENLEKEKEETKTAKEELKDKKKEKKNIKKSKKQDKKQAKKKKKTEKIQKKIDKMKTNESVVYNFDEFMKKTRDLS